jgi:hypothetical protein
MASIELQQILSKNLASESRLQVRKLFQKSFQKKKNEMIAEFLNHPVTQEIKGGVSANNLSGTLGNVTNLFSFIGFESGDDPIDPILEILEQTTFDFMSSSGNKINYRVNLPLKEQIFSVTPFPYSSGRSWVKGIETGISGLGFYLKVRRDSSRSGLGIQTPKRVRKKGVKFRNTKYISSLLKKYEIEFKNLQL